MGTILSVGGQILNVAHNNLIKTQLYLSSSTLSRLFPEPTHMVWTITSQRDRTMAAQKPHNAHPLSPSMRGIALSSRLEQSMTNQMLGFNQNPCNYKYRLCSDGKHNIVFIISIIENYCQCLSIKQKTIVSFLQIKHVGVSRVMESHLKKLSAILDLYA